MMARDPAVGALSFAADESQQMTWCWIQDLRNENGEDNTYPLELKLADEMITRRRSS
jgi:hypothetical protein